MKVHSQQYFATGVHSGKLVCHRTSPSNYNDPTVTLWFNCAFWISYCDHLPITGSPAFLPINLSSILFLFFPFVSTQNALNFLLIVSTNAKAYSFSFYSFFSETGILFLSDFSTSLHFFQVSTMSSLANFAFLLTFDDFQIWYFKVI